MLQWLIGFSEFAEITEFLFHLGKMDMSLIYVTSMFREKTEHFSLLGNHGFIHKYHAHSYAQK